MCVCMCTMSVYVCVYHLQLDIFWQVTSLCIPHMGIGGNSST